MAFCTQGVETLCILALRQVQKWGECIKSLKREASLYGQNLQPSETDAVLEYFLSLIFPSLSVSLFDLLFMPMVTPEASRVPGECEISLAGQQLAQRQTPASSCGILPSLPPRPCAALSGFKRLCQALAESLRRDNGEDTDTCRSEWHIKTK